MQADDGEDRAAIGLAMVLVLARFLSSGLLPDDALIVNWITTLEPIDRL